MALPAPRSPSGPGPRARTIAADVHGTHPLAPARGVAIGLTLALAAFWGPLVAGLYWLLA